MEPTSTDADHRDERALEDLGEIARSLDEVMSGDRPEPVDVRAYLLDPPPTAEQAERLERRRRLVRNGSIAAAAVLAVLLLAPWPSANRRAADPGSHEPGAELATAVEPAGPTGPAAADLPVRIDAEPPSGRSRAARARKVTPRPARAVVRARAHAARPSAPPHRVAPAPPAAPAARPVPTRAPAPAPRAATPAAAPPSSNQRPSPAAPAPQADQSAGDGGELTPVM